VFAVDPSFTHLAARREQVLVLVQSINALSVKVPGFPTSPAMACLVGWDVGNNHATLAIHLHFAKSKKGVAYLHEPKVFAITDLPDVTAEAVEFLESMGFMLDDAAYGTLKPEEQVALMERTPVFHQDLARYASSHEGREQGDAGDIPEVEMIEVAEKSPAAIEPQGPQTNEPSERSRAFGRMLMSF